MKPCSLIAALLAALAVWGQSNRAERFDTSGMPRRPTTFVEQQIFEMIATHKPGDLTDAARIQRKLGAYYVDKGDEERATTAFLAAAAAEPASGARGEEAKPKLSPTPEEKAGEGPAVARTARREEKTGASFTGSYFGYQGRTLHTWEFRADGTFLHTWIVSGSGTSVRNSERGTYRLLGHRIELKLVSAAGGFVTPGVGGRTTVVGGGAEEHSSVRLLTFERTEAGIALDGISLKTKSW